LILEITHSDFVALLDFCNSAVAVVDSDNNLLYANRHFLNYQPSLQHKFICSTLFSNTSYLVRSKKLGNNRAVIIDSISHKGNDSDKLLSSMLDKISFSDDIFNATAESIHEITGWRWIFVTKFTDDFNVEVLAFWDTQKIVKAGSYSLPNTPCEVMVRNKKFTIFSDVALSFPKNELLVQLGAKSYAGLVYYGKDHQPIGHIMGMHDSLDVDYQHIENVIKLATLAISSHLMLSHTQSELKSVKSMVDFDGLTQLRNRKAFENSCDKLAIDYRDKAENACIAIMDLDNFKYFNDTYGHPKGDHLLRLFATELAKIGRVNDQAFRLGGDEFALLLPNVNLKGASRLHQQMLDIEHRISLMLGSPIQVSIGFAAYDEVSGDQDACYALSDKRMYENKALKK
jgi:diguanylate cyclase (GGDEF)-like protein